MNSFELSPFSDSITLKIEHSQATTGMLDRRIGMNELPDKVYERKKNRTRVRREIDETISRLTQGKRKKTLWESFTHAKRYLTQSPFSSPAGEALGSILKDKSNLMGCP